MVWLRMRVAGTVNSFAEPSTHWNGNTWKMLLSARHRVTVTRSSGLPSRLRVQLPQEVAVATSSTFEEVPRTISIIGRLK